MGAAQSNATALPAMPDLEPSVAMSWLCDQLCVELQSETEASPMTPMALQLIWIGTTTSPVTLLPLRPDSVGLKPPSPTCEGLIGLMFLLSSASAALTG